MKHTDSTCRLRRIVAATALGALCLATPSTAQNLNLPSRTVPGGGLRAGDPGPLGIGPGKVRFSFTRGGRSIALTPAWNEGISLISGGGFIAFATGPEGELVELANTSFDNQTVADGSKNIPLCYEGMTGGFRAPSLDPDDDGDGRADEDRLDGLDNDADGKIDEDFAAIGDEMAVTEFTSAAPSMGARLSFHQECYAWSLPHIDGAVMISLQVRNEGTGPLYDLRLGKLLQVQDRFFFSEPIMNTRVRSGMSSSVPCWVSSTRNGGSVVLVALPAEDGTGGWLGGWVPVSRDFGSAVRGTVAGDRKIAQQPGGAARARSGLDGVQVDGDANIYALSPAFEVLFPGEEVRVDFALVAVPPGAAIDKAAVDAFKTYRGDGRHRYLPPPVSMTPRVLWGYYRPLEDGASGLAVELEGSGGVPVRAADISYLSGLDRSRLDHHETLGDEAMTIVIRDRGIERSSRRGERVTLKGRLRSGEFFEAILRPRRLVTEPSSSSDVEAQRFWKSSGKLDRELLTGSPNPFRVSTTVFYEVPQLIETDDGRRILSRGAFETSVKVYNVRGRLVSVLVDRQQFPGIHSVNWNAVDDSGNPVASGVYYVKLQIEQRFITRRLTLLR